MNTTIIYRSPVRGGDVRELAKLIADADCIVSCEPDFAAGDWDAFIEEHVRFGTEFFAHLDLNFTARISEFTKDEPKTELQKQTAAVMCLAICAHMKVNPTFASNEYLFSGSFDPEKRLAYFYFINNTHPQILANLALGRIHSISSGELPPTNQFGAPPKRTRLFGLVHLALLKLMELHTSESSQTLSKPERGAARIAALLKWMHHDFLIVGSVMTFAHELWGSNSVKSIVTSPNSTDAVKLLESVENAAWDLCLAENWADWEGKRLPNDPMNMIFTHDRALRRIACSLLSAPGTEDVDRPYLESLKTMWPESIAKELFQCQRRLESDLDNPSRRYPNASDKDKYYEHIKDALIRTIKANCDSKHKL